MQVPLRANGDPLGLLSIDTRSSTTFSDEHVAIARTAASIISLGMAEVLRAAADTSDEVGEVLERVKTAKRSATADAVSVAPTSIGSDVEGEED